MYCYCFQKCHWMNRFRLYKSFLTNLRGRSQDFISVELDKVIEEKPAEFTRLTKMDKAEVYVRATILEHCIKIFWTKESAAIYYMGERLANDYEECVQWFLDPQNSKMKVTIMEKLTSKIITMKTTVKVKCVSKKEMINYDPLETYCNFY